MTTQRLEAFSDGVFAVAATLLALDVRIPASPETNTEPALYRAVLALAPRLFIFITTFVVVAMFWIGHHRMYASIRHVDRLLLWLNNIFLLLICLLPFSADTLGSHLLLRTAVILYGSNIILIGQTQFAIWRYACAKRLLEANVTPEYIRDTQIRILIGAPIYAIGVALAFWQPVVSNIVYLLALILYLLPSRIDRHFQPEASNPQLDA